MKAAEFKNGIKAIKENLKGITCQFITKNQVRPYTNLYEFGCAILSEEKKGNGFSINQAWLEEGVVKVGTIEALIELFKTKSVTAIQFESYVTYDTVNDFMKSSGSLD